jgi:hypothetical protein
MEWKAVRAVCNCPNRLESKMCWSGSDDVDSIGEAKEVVNQGINEHIEKSEHCTRETVDKTVYWEDSW